MLILFLNEKFVRNVFHLGKYVMIYGRDPVRENIGADVNCVSFLDDFNLRFIVLTNFSKYMQYTVSYKQLQWFVSSEKRRIVIANVTVAFLRHLFRLRRNKNAGI
jgi:hypothetical protein